MTAPTLDPFDTPTKVPTVTFDKMPVGTTYKLRVTAPAEKAQGKDFETGGPAVWQNDDGSTSPKYSAVIRVQVLDNGGNPAMTNGEERAIWAVMPSAMFAALQEARANAGNVPFAPGGILSVRYSGDQPNKKNPRLNPAKQYQAKYEPGAPPAPADPFGDSAPAGNSVLPGAQDKGADWGDAAPPW